MAGEDLFSFSVSRVMVLGLVQGYCGSPTAWGRTLVAE